MGVWWINGSRRPWKSSSKNRRPFPLFAARKSAKQRDGGMQFGSTTMWFAKYNVFIDRETHKKSGY